MNGHEHDDEDEPNSAWGFSPDKGEHKTCPTCGQLMTVDHGTSPFGRRHDGNRPRRLRDGSWLGEPPTVVGIWTPMELWYCNVCGANKKFVTGSGAEGGVLALNQASVLGAYSPATYRSELIGILRNELGVATMSEVPAGVRDEVAAFHRDESRRDNARRDRRYNDAFEQPSPHLPRLDQSVPQIGSGFRPFLERTLYDDYVGIPEVDILAMWDPATETATVPFGIGDYVDMKDGSTIGPRSSLWHYLRFLERAEQRENSRVRTFFGLLDDDDEDDDE